MAVRIVASHTFDPQTDVCVQCRRGRMHIIYAGPADCDGIIEWREWLRLSPYPTWQLEPALNVGSLSQPKQGEQK